MYSKKFRLAVEETKRKKPKQTISLPFFLIKVFENEVVHPRFGIIISSAAVKNAARRNFWRRIIADEIKKSAENQKDILVIVFKKINEATAEEVKEALRTFGEKIKQNF
ncbi:MAG: ribonuclease P protein component [Patescibacteria group bacterium]